MSSSQHSARQFMPNSPSPPRGMIFSFLVCICQLDATTCGLRGIVSAGESSLNSDSDADRCRIPDRAEAAERTVKSIPGGGAVCGPPTSRIYGPQRRCSMPGPVNNSWKQGFNLLRYDSLVIETILYGLWNWGER
jgi:hypothetical protein